MSIKYPVGEQNFESIREEGKVYVDKTPLIYEMVNGAKYVFLTRPRRFGKSLLLSTLRAFYEGKKDLFKGLDIYEKEKVWDDYPVLQLSFALFNSEDGRSLDHILENHFREWENLYDIKERDLSFAERFKNIIKNAFLKTGKRAVILIDEYDHALVNVIHREEIYTRNRELLKSVYSNLKEMDGFIKFAFLTGVTRFSKAGIFSGLNNLTDITFEEKYSSICGFSEKEIRKYLWKGVEILGQKEEVSHEEALQLLKNDYDGYHFAKDLLDIYNPYSLLRALRASELENYWIDSGTPSFLIEKLKESSESFTELFNQEADTTDLTAVDSFFSSPAALLFQTGYLTIKDYDSATNLYKLGVPNKEVREGFFTVLLSNFVEKDRRKTLRVIQQLKNGLQDGNPQDFIERVQSFFEGISYKLMPKAPEIYFENNLFLIINLMGFEVKAEDETSNGRIDLSVFTDKFIYLFEIKKDKSPEEALAQIEKKNYALKYKFDNRKIFKIGVDFSSEKRNISSWIISE